MPYIFERYRAGSSFPEGGAPVGYLASRELAVAVNTALAAEQPLLVAGEPGTGKTTLAESIAAQLGLGPVLAFHTRSDHFARDVLYSYDTMRRFYDSQWNRLEAERATTYREFEALGIAIQQATDEGRASVVLIDEIDKAPRDFPNDLLNVIENLEFSIPWTREHKRVPAGAPRPVIVITSNSERPLPEAFLRRCVFHYIEFPDREELLRILRARLGAERGSQPIAQVAVDRFIALRTSLERQRPDKPPATGELLKWVQVLLRAAYPVEKLLDEHEPLPFLGVMLKTNDDLRKARAAAG